MDLQDEKLKRLVYDLFLLLDDKNTGYVSADQFSRLQAQAAKLLISLQFKKRFLSSNSHNLQQIFPGDSSVAGLTENPNIHDSKRDDNFLVVEKGGPTNNKSAPQ